MPSFDVVSKVEIQEVRNAVEQVKREIGTRYDFRASKSTIEFDDKLITLLADDKMQLASLQELLRQKLTKRGISLKSVTFKDAEPAASDALRQLVEIKQGLSMEELKRLNAEIKASKLKVTAQIQGEQLRISGKKRDDLQTVISQLRKTASDLELQFTNFRD
jgi:uncharacterized protein YajQ (UPF0234 family)